MTSRFLISAMAVGLISATAAGASTSTGTPATPHSAHHAKATVHAKISADAAQATALGLVPGGHIKSHELEREHGHLIYSFDIEVAGKSGIEEVNVDAMTGKVLARQHETPRSERHEKAMEKKESGKP
jgi:uncharacterized membrane protein YkoI